MTLVLVVLSSLDFILTYVDTDIVVMRDGQSIGFVRTAFK